MADIKTTMRIIDQISAPMRQIASATEHTTRTLNKISSSGNGLGKAKTDTGQMVQKMSAFKGKTDQASQSASRMGGIFSGVAGKVSGLVSAYAGMQGVKMTLGLSDELTNINARMDLMKDKHNTVAGLQDKIFASAQRSRGSYQATADAVGKMGLMAKDAFSGNDELVSFMEQINKQFTIAGTSQDGQAAAMLQLTQAMGAGALRGEELNSIFEQAPTIIQTIADHLGKPVGAIRGLAEDGKLTGKVVKEALLGAADETNKKFNSMPKTWSQRMTQIKNIAIDKFKPILGKISEIANSKDFDVFVKKLEAGFGKVAETIPKLISEAKNFGKMVADNWNIIKPAIVGVVGVVTVYKTAMLGVKVVSGIVAAATRVLTAVTTIWSGVTKGAAVAQKLLNVAMRACPAFWIVTAIVAVIAILIALWKKSEGFRNFWKGVWDAIKKAVGSAATAVTTKVGEIKTKITDTFKSIIAWIKDKASSFKNAGKNIMDGLKNGIMSGIEKVKDKVRGAVDSIKKFFNIGFEVKSPSRWMRRFGGYLMEGLNIGMDKGLPDIVRKTTEVTTVVKKIMPQEIKTPEAVQTTGSKIGKINRNIMTGLASGFLDGLKKGVNQVEQLKANLNLGINGSFPSVIQRTEKITEVVKQAAPARQTVPAVMQGPVGTTKNTAYHNDNRKTNNKMVVNVTVTKESDENRLVDKLRELMNNSAEGVHI